MPARVQGLQIAFGSAKQTNISTPSSTFNRFLKLNADVPYLLANTENDAAEIGKGHEFVTGVFLTNIEPANTRIEKYGSAEFMTWAWAYALGNVQLATGLYTIKPIDNGVTLELPYFTVGLKLPEGGGNAVDEAHIGCAIESVQTDFHYGPGRDSVKTTCEYVGSGVSAIPSAVTFPSVLSEHYARSSGMSISINGIDYVAGTPGAKTALMGSIGWKNNLLLPMRYFPGSGLDSNGFAVGGRILIGVRQPSFTFTAFLQHDSTEYAKLVAQTVGTAVVTLTFDATHFVTWTFSSVSFERVERGQEEGIVAVTMTIAPRYDATNGVLVVTAKNSISDIAQ